MRDPVLLRDFLVFHLFTLSQWAVNLSTSLQRLRWTNPMSQTYPAYLVINILLLNIYSPHDLISSDTHPVFKVNDHQISLYSSNYLTEIIGCLYEVICCLISVQMYPTLQPYFNLTKIGWCMAISTDSKMIARNQNGRQNTNNILHFNQENISLQNLNESLPQTNQIRPR